MLDSDRPNARLSPGTPARCPECGYRLFGLPAEGKCPECGAEYDGASIILYGWAIGSNASIADGKGWRVAASLLWGVGIAAAGLFAFVGTRSLEGFFYMTVFGLSVVVGLWQRRRVLADAPAPVQV